MKLLLAVAAMAGLTTQQPQSPSPVTTPPVVNTVVVARQYDNPNDVNWHIGYMSGLNLLVLSWPSFNNPLIPYVTVTFQGVSKNVNLNTTFNMYFESITLTVNTNYTINIAGRNYYFHLDVNGNCVITGHD